MISSSAGDSPRSYRSLHSARILRSQTALAEVFGVPFEPFYFTDSWQPITEFPLGQAALPGSATAAETLLNRFFGNERRSLVHPLPDGRTALLIRLNPDAGQPIVAAGVVAGDLTEVLEKLVGMVEQLAHFQHTIEEQRKDIDDFAQQVSLDFEELTWLRRLTEQLEYCAVSRPVQQVAEKLLPSLRGIIGAEALILILKKEDGTGADVSLGAEPSLRTGLPPLSDEECRKLIAQLELRTSLQPIVKNHLHNTPEFAMFPDLHSCILVSVAHRETHLGWLLALNCIQNNLHEGDLQRAFANHDGEFGTVESSLMSSAAVMLGTHGKNAALFREKEALLTGVIRSLINAMDAKDSYTCGHSDRVALIAKRIGEELKLDHQECERLYMTGLLHDIGKIGVPDDVLLKPGKLTNDEYTKIKRHPEIGYSILKHVTQLNYALPGVLHHHETVNGKGYPHALAAEQIPLFGRILAVADAYDAMTSSRPYRTAMPAEKAESILKEGSGQQWDENVLAAFFNARNDIQHICDESRDHTQAILHPDETGGTETGVSHPDAIALAVAATSNDSFSAASGEASTQSEESHAN